MSQHSRKTGFFIVLYVVLSFVYVLCVSAAGQPQALRINTNQDGTLTDTKTGLVWISDFKKNARSLEEARNICASLEFAGKKNWRLPTAPELAEFIKYLRSGKERVRFVVLEETDTGALYWTSSLFVQDANNQRAFILKTERPPVQTVNRLGDIVIHGGGESDHDYVIPVRVSKP